MKYSISAGREIEALPHDANAVHLARPLGIAALKKLASKGIREASASDSTLKRFSKKSRDFLEQSGVRLKKQSAKGRPIGIGMQRMLEVIEMRKDYKSLRKIEEATQVPKSTVHYLVRHARRGKVKLKNQVIHLK